MCSFWILKCFSFLILCEIKQILKVWILQFLYDFLSCPECIYKCQDCIHVSYKTLYSKQRNRIYPGDIYLLSYWLSSGLIPPDSHCATSFISFSSLYPEPPVNIGPWEPRYCEKSFLSFLSFLLFFYILLLIFLWKLTNIKI